MKYDNLTFKEHLASFKNVQRDELYKLSSEIAPLDGLILEFGVATGHSINLIAGYFAPRSVYGFDSFEGLPESWNGMGEGTFACSVPDVIDNVILIKGLFQDILDDFVLQHAGAKISYLHIDSDLYSSCKYVLETLDHMIIPGTIIQFDELCGYASWEDHEFKAFNEYLETSGKDCEIIASDHTSFEQVVCKII